MARTTQFQSFWMGGYECADHINKHGDRIDLLAATGHIEQLESDYLLLDEWNIKTVREGIRWSVVEYAPYQYDWSTVIYMLERAKALGIQQIWDICHFGLPDDLSPLHPKFSDRFVSVCCSFVAAYRSVCPHATIYLTPINEVSFLSWLGGDAAGTVPFCVNQGWEVKYHLMKAYIKAVAAVKSIDANVRIVSTEPLVNIAAHEGGSYIDQLDAYQQTEEQHQAMDMLCGAMCPELGGQPEYLDIVGVNFYYTNQWIHGTNTALPWAQHDRHPLWRPLHQLVADIFHRYRKPVMISETSHPGADRGLWIAHIAEECAAMLARDLPLLGICIYPIVDRPDWDDLSLLHRSGLWGTINDTAPPAREIFQPMADALYDAQRKLPISLQKTKLADLAVTGA